MTPADLDIATAGARLRTGSLTAVALAEAHLARIRERDPALRAFVAVAEARGLADAERADAELACGLDRGPLHGIPVALKDVIDVADLPTRCGSRATPAGPAPSDAAVTARLAAAGAVIIGKLATYEFALAGPDLGHDPPPALNPWDAGRITGGSSSGAAAAVAGGLLRTAIGTDTGGSVRSPACYCGVVGLKPTFGRVPVAGVAALATSLDHVGPISATVAEAALTLDALADAGAAARLGEGIEGLRIAYARAWFAADPETAPELVAAMDGAASVLSLLGARIEEVSLPPYEHFHASGAVILHSEALATHRDRLRARSVEYGRAALGNLAWGLALTADDLDRARRVGRALTETLDREVFARFDALVTACALGPAPPVARPGEPPRWTPMRTLPFNLTGHPALALPIGFAGGLPLGMQVVGRRGDEAGICRIGHAFERATDHAVLRPSLAPGP